MITTDIGGSLKETKRGNKYFIVIIDHFTKFIQILPLINIKAEDIALVLVDKRIMIFWIPETRLPDGGTQYRIILLEAVYEYLDINGLKTFSFHPQCNGQSEKTVRTAKAMIRTHVDDKQEDGDLM